MYEISSFDHLAAKVDALTQKIEKMNVSVVTPTSVSPPCEICGVFGHIGVDSLYMISLLRKKFQRKRP